ncbi:MAG: DUF4491 family protein [Bacteroidales bacterium]|nr:DUF4491 family protein [Bacteroidales bacterium]
MNWEALLIGVVAFLTIGIFHPVVVRLEYHYGKGIWWAVFFPGLILAVLSMFVTGYFSLILGVIAFGCFWTTVEIFFQHDRVLKGQAAKNPKRKYHG